MNADRAPDHSSPEFKNRDYFLGLLYLKATGWRGEIHKIP
jgi:hypothetical protein